jgi:hypothetical protein
VKLEIKGHIHQRYKTLLMTIGHMPQEGLAKTNNLITPFKPCFYSQGYAMLQHKSKQKIIGKIH